MLTSLVGVREAKTQEGASTESRDTFKTVNVLLEMRFFNDYNAIAATRAELLSPGS
jgi:hypothetical protein